MSAKDIRVFYSKGARAWIIANDYKMRRLMSKGWSRKEARDESHGHLAKKKDAETMKEDILSNRKTKSRDLYIIKCYIRVTDDAYRYYDWICGLYNSKTNKDNKYYYNVNRGQNK